MAGSLLGHSRPTMNVRYAHLANDLLLDAAQSIAADITNMVRPEPASERARQAASPVLASTAIRSGADPRCAKAMNCQPHHRTCVDVRYPSLYGMDKQRTFPTCTGRIACRIFKIRTDAQEMKRLILAATLFFPLQGFLLPAPVRAQTPSASEVAAIRRSAEQGAEQGNSGDQRLLGSMYYLGNGVAQDYAKAAYWLRRAAEQGDAKAQVMLGEMYHDGTGVAQDYVQSASWYRKAAEQGNEYAQRTLGLMYFSGDGVPQDYTQAANWLRKGAEQGDAEAQYVLGLLFYKGEGVAHDYALAANWFRKAATQGNPLAQEMLGAMYSDGDGMPQDYVLAYAWVNLSASRSGSEETRKLRNKIARNLAPEQLAEAQRLSSNWRKGQSIQRQKQ